jgi:glycogen(starch) synthase
MNMKVLMYGWEFPPNISGGLGVACYSIVNELAKKNIDLTLILPQTINNPDIQNLDLISCDGIDCNVDFIFDGLVKIKYSKIFSNISPYLKTHNFKNALSNETFENFSRLLACIHLPDEIKNIFMFATEEMHSMNLLAAVLKYALIAGEFSKDIPCDVIYAHDWLTILAALEAKYYTHKPLIIHIHSLETDRSGFWIDKKIFAIEKLGMEQADHIIAVSQYTKDNIVKYYFIDPNKITVVHNGIYFDISCNQALTNDDRLPMVLFLGRITQQKGPSFFIDIAKKVLEINPEVHFVLVGSGDLLTGMIERTANLRLGKNVHFTGFLPREKVREIYQLADVYVMPSVSEPFGLSALEALSYNIPAIISKQSGVAEVLRHTSTANFWDVDDMAAKILALLKYATLRKTMLSAESQELQKLTWDKAAEKIIQVYKKIIKG